jgi:VanZ family protein
MTSFRVLTWCSIILLAVLSLLPAQKMMRTGLPGRLEHFVAYAGSAAVAMAGYGASRGGVQIIGGFWVYAGILEYLQHFSPGRHPAIAPGNVCYLRQFGKNMLTRSFTVRDPIRSFRM